jgi:hypothetical protein
MAPSGLVDLVGDGDGQLAGRGEAAGMHQLAVLLLHGLLRQAATTPLDQEPPNESALDQEHQHAADRLASMLLREWRLFEVDDGGARNPGRADAPATDLSPVEVHDRQRDGGQVETLRRGSRQQHALRLPSLVPTVAKLTIEPPTMPAHRGTRRRSVPSPGVPRPVRRPWRGWSTAGDHLE